MDDLRITEIFYSLQGESCSVGVPTVFVRLTGCPLRCQYCDSAYAFHGGKKISVPDIIKTVQQYPAQYVTISGGEPLVQPKVHSLMSQLCDLGYELSIETSGALSVEAVDRRVSIVLDIKTPGSQEAHRNDWSNCTLLKKTDQIKFVICDKNDFDYACTIIAKYQLEKIGCALLFSPSYQQCRPEELAQWVLDAGIHHARFQMQLHKILWGNKPGV